MPSRAALPLIEPLHECAQVWDPSPLPVDTTTTTTTNHQQHHHHHHHNCAPRLARDTAVIAGTSLLPGHLIVLVEQPPVAFLAKTKASLSIIFGPADG